jgi:hypothetical protein
LLAEEVDIEQSPSRSLPELLSRLARLASRAPSVLVYLNATLVGQFDIWLRQHCYDIPGFGLRLKASSNIDWSSGLRWVNCVFFGSFGTVLLTKSVFASGEPMACHPRLAASCAEWWWTSD